MGKFTPEILAKMQDEDSWLRSKSGILLMSFAQASNCIPLGLETTIQIAELEAVDYDKSAALHHFLGSQYQMLSEELSDKLKLDIEKQKLKKAGKEYLLDYGKKSKDEITCSLPHKGMDLGENIQAAIDMMNSWSIINYLQKNNSQRVYHHLEQSLRLSGENPTVFKHLINPFASVKLGQMAINKGVRLEGKGKYDIYLDYNPAEAFFASSYKVARERLGIN